MCRMVCRCVTAPQIELRIPIWRYSGIAPRIGRSVSPAMQLLDAAVVCAIALGVIALSVLRRREIADMRLSLWRVLVPSWRFFEQVHPGPRLFCRIAAGNRELSPWIELLPAPRRAWSTLILNAQGNLRLACLSALEHLRDDLDALTPQQDPAALLSYQLVCCIVQTQLHTLPEALDCERFQFCVAEPAVGEPADLGGPLLISEIHTHRPRRCGTWAA